MNSYSATRPGGSSDHVILVSKLKAQGLSDEKIGARLGLSSGQVKTIRDRARIRPPAGSHGLPRTAQPIGYDHSREARLNRFTEAQEEAFAKALAGRRFDSFRIQPAPLAKRMQAAPAFVPSGSSIE